MIGSPADAQPVIPPETELEIALRAGSGELRAFEWLVGVHKANVVAVVRRYVPREAIDEVSHDVFVKAYFSLASFRGESPLRYWFTKIAIRSSYDYWRGIRATNSVVLSSEHLERLDAERSVSHHSQAEAAALDRELLAWALSKLSAEDRMVVTMLYLERYSEKEIAALLGWSRAKVKARAFQSKRHLKRLVGELEGK